jgi:hypothetical protein
LGIFSCPESNENYSKIFENLVPFFVEDIEIVGYTFHLDYTVCTDLVTFHYITCPNSEEPGGICSHKTQQDSSILDFWIN